MATLTLPQPPPALLYPHRVTVYRPDIPLAADGQPLDSGTTVTWSLVGTGVACYLEGTPNQTMPVEFLQVEEANFFTTDKFHLPTAADVASGDVLKLTTHEKASLVGQYWRIQGNPEDHNFVSDKRIVRGKVTLKPAGVP